MSDEDPIRPQTHTLGELLQDHATAGDKAREAAKSAPIVVIAIMAHVVVLAVLAMMYIHTDTKKETDALTAQMHNALNDQKLEDAKPEEKKEADMTPIPKTDEVDVKPDENPEFNTVVDDVVNPDATSTDKFGVVEGQDDAQQDLMSMSNGGKGLAGAIGVGSGSGAGGGARKGNPNGGSRLSRRNQQKGNLKDTETVVHAALEWLRRHQNGDGSWSAAAYMQNCDGKRGAACTGRGSAVYDVGVSGLALLAFEGAGYDTSQTGIYPEVIKKGLKYLKNVQDPEGCFGSRGYEHFTYAQACATIAMCEAYGASKQNYWKKPAQSAVDFCQLCRNPYKAWRYGMKPGDNDSSVTGWMLMAMHSARDADLIVDTTAMKEALQFVELMTDEDTGRTGYTKKGEIPVRREGTTQWPATESESLTAVAMCSRIFCDASDGNPAMKKGAELLSKKLPVWDEPGGKIDMYYWYYGTLAMFQLGGSEWERWNKNLKTAIVDSQIKGTGCTEGSWDPKDPWGEEGGRVYSTATLALCLEVYYRFPRATMVKKPTAGGQKPASQPAK